MRSPATTSVSPRSTRRSASTFASGQSVRLASVLVFTLPSLRKLSRKSTAGGDDRFGTRVTYMNSIDHEQPHRKTPCYMPTYRPAKCLFSESLQILELETGAEVRSNLSGRLPSSTTA